MTIEQYRTLAQALGRRADNHRAAIQRQMREAGRAAGLGDSMPAHLAHNAMVSYDYGRPWAELDYSHVRRVLWLERRQFEAHAIVDRVLARAWGNLAR